MYRRRGRPRKYDTTRYIPKIVEKVEEECGQKIREIRAFMNFNVLEGDAIITLRIGEYPHAINFVEICFNEGCDATDHFFAFSDYGFCGILGALGMLGGGSSSLPITEFEDEEEVFETIRDFIYRLHHAFLVLCVSARDEAACVECEGVVISDYKYDDGKVAINTQPKLRSMAFASLKPGDQARLIKKIPNGEDFWYLIETKTGLRGWVDSWKVKVINE